MLLKITLLAILFISTLNTSFLEAHKSNPLSFEDIIPLILENNIDIKLSKINMNKSQVSYKQKSLWRNPTVDIDWDNWGGSKDTANKEDLESTWSFSKSIDFSQQGHFSKKIGRLDKIYHEKIFDHTQRETLSKASNTFALILKMQSDLNLAKKRSVLLEEMLAVATKKMKAGRCSEVELLSIQALLAEGKINILEAQENLKIKKHKLERFWNHDAKILGSVYGTLENIPPLPSIDDLKNSLDNNIEIIKMKYDIKKASITFDLEKRKVLPTVDLKIGTRFLQESDQNTWVASLSIPLPLFDQNQNAIKLAKIEKKANSLDFEMNNKRIEVSFLEQYQHLKLLLRKINIMKEKIIPLNLRALHLTHKGYHQGAFSYFEVLSAEKKSFDVQEKIISFAAQYIKKYNNLMLYVGKDPYVYGSKKSKEKE
ncbi:hypothetical protein AB834_07615 [PVC group bacterium (ex Bugula neritina AB1)]|nr:hypothetical protein AB834_07615 [PVC group bacterium (ex Bugula neritina AB1)]